MTGRVIEGDLFGICDRLKSIDDGYYIFLNYKTGKFEVHNSKDAVTLCMVLPYDRLDERTVRRVQRTRAEKIDELVKAMDEHNESLRRKSLSAAVQKVAAEVCL